MLYHIKSLNPVLEMSGFGFNISLYPAWKQEVKKLDIDQNKINILLLNMGESWLRACRFDYVLDSELGTDFSIRMSLRMSWGEWGPEHISVPGTACGLDPADGPGTPLVESRYTHTMLIT